MEQERAIITVSETTHVARDPLTVFDFTQDYGRRSEWDPAVRRAHVLDEAPRRVRVAVRGLGSFTIEYRLFRRGERTSAAFVDVDSWVISGGGGSWAYEGQGDGTDWTQTNTIELRHPRLLGWMKPLLERSLRTSMRTAMSNARSMLESGGPAEPTS